MKRGNQHRRMPKALRGILTGLLAILAVVLVWALAHQLLSIGIKAIPGRLGTEVLVNGKGMNVYACGGGERTIVLMPGLGTAAPILDFEPLTQRLAKQNRVVVVEPFGYGWSDCSDKERSVGTIVEELRAALTEAGESAPYVLMPHSISGIYAAWYAAHYPEEVAAIIGIDCTLPRQTAYFDGAAPGVPGIAKLANPLGLARLLCLVSPETLISSNSAGAYPAENLRLQKKLASARGYNRNVIDEMNRVGANIEETKDIVFNPKLPLLFITRPDSDRASRADGKTIVGFYETYITNPDCQQVTTYSAQHYMHWTRSEEIARAAETFLSTHPAESCGFDGALETK